MSNDTTTIDRQAAQIAMLREALDHISVQCVQSDIAPDHYLISKVEFDQTVPAALAATEQDVAKWQAAQIAMLREALHVGRALTMGYINGALTEKSKDEAIADLQIINAALNATAADVEEAADELDRLQAELAAAKLVDESSIVAELRKRVADQGNGCAEGLTTIPAIILSHAADYITHVQTKLRREEEKTEALTIKLAAAEKDAERYRWLRHGDNDELVLVTYERHTEMTPPAYLPRSEELDAAIDAALAKQEPKNVD